MNVDFRFPSEIKELITTLGDKKQWRILELLISNDNKLSYTQLKDKLEVPEKQKGKLNYHLKELQKGGWIRNWLKAGTTSAERQKSFYSISEFGQKVIEGTMNAMAMQSYTGNTWSQLQETIREPIKIFEDIVDESVIERPTTIRMVYAPIAPKKMIAEMKGPIGWNIVPLKESEEGTQKNFQLVSFLHRRKISA